MSGLVGWLHIALRRINNFSTIRDEIKFIDLKDKSRHKFMWCVGLCEFFELLCTSAHFLPF